MWHATGVHFRSSVESALIHSSCRMVAKLNLELAVGEGVTVRGDEVSGVSARWVWNSAAFGVAVRGRREEGQLYGETVAQKEGGL